jgi:monofunctional biosynthetic peptidoglycan transglycosylase
MRRRVPAAADSKAPPGLDFLRSGPDAASAEGQAPGRPSDRRGMGVLADRLLWWRRYRPPPRRGRRVLRALALAIVAAVAVCVLAVLGLRWIDPPTTAFMLEARHAAHARGEDDFRIRHYWVDWPYIAGAAKVAVVAAEDQRFLEHDGFDVESIADAVYERVKRGRERGASTVSQQVAKNLFLWPGKSFLRKGLEAWFTLLIEHLWPKQRVLEVYLNVAQFGDGVFGVEAASLLYFCKPASDLSPGEAATLAAVLPNPVRFRADDPSPYVRSRSRWILAQMRRLGGTDLLDPLR